MDTPLATNIINSLVAIGTLIVAVVAIVAIFQNRSQARNDWLHSQQLATDDRQHQSRPIIVPVGEFESVSPYLARGNTPYKGDGLVNWAYPDPIQLELQNMGGGVALNVHCVLYGSEPIHISQFVSWDNGPIGKGPIHIKYEHPQQLFLNPDDSIDGIHPLFDTSPNSPSNPVEQRIACLTVTYHDLFEIKHVSIFNYTLEHRWICMATSRIPSLNGKPPLDLKELNDQKKQQGTKLSAPPIKTSP